MISKQKAEKAIRKVFPDSRISSIKRFKKGLVNESYSVKIINPDKELVLRIYPKEAKTTPSGTIRSLPKPILPNIPLFAGAW